MNLSSGSDSDGFLDDCVPVDFDFGNGFGNLDLSRLFKIRLTRGFNPLPALCCPRVLCSSPTFIPNTHPHRGTMSNANYPVVKIDLVRYDAEHRGTESSSNVS